MLDRRDTLKLLALASLGTRCGSLAPALGQQEWANDVHSQLNATRLAGIVPIHSGHELRSVLRSAARDGSKVSIAGSRHAMGGQQFGAGTINLDMRTMRRIGDLDSTSGIIEVEGGVEWPQLVQHLLERQQRWGIAQKQTGADHLTIGGALAANVHGRGLRMKPFVHDIESFTIFTADGERHECSRTKNRELFSLAIGGYGLFGVVDSVRLRLVPRYRVERIVEIRSTEGLMKAFDERMAAGYTFGDFQFSIDERSKSFMRDGVFSCYRPTEREAPPAQEELSRESWSDLMQLAHFDKAKAYELYTRYYSGTSGQVYWSDTHQLTTYVNDYHHRIDQRAGKRGSEIITEIYVPRERLTDFMEEAREDFLRHHVNLFYGTIRLIEADDETFLAWAKRPYACIIFNLHTEHSADALARTAEDFRRLIDMAIRRGGSYYLTYHRYARRDQVDACYPQFAAFLAAKKKLDPKERFESEWYRHYRRMYSA
jgi:FAD/FMN-containing dehydrogenase